MPSPPPAPSNSEAGGVEATIVYEISESRLFCLLSCVLYPFYAYIKQMNVEMNTWGVPVVNFLGALDNCAGNGQWRMATK